MPWNIYSFGEGEYLNLALNSQILNVHIFKQFFTRALMQREKMKKEDLLCSKVLILLYFPQYLTRIKQS